MSGKVGESKPFNGNSKSDEKLKRLTEELSKISKSFADQIKSIKSYVDVMKNVISNTKQKKENKEDFSSLASGITKSFKSILSQQSSSKEISKILSESKGIATAVRQLSRMISPLVQAGLKKGSIYVHDIYAQELLRKIAERQGVGATELNRIPNEFARVAAKAQADIAAGMNPEEAFEKVIKKENRKTFTQQQRRGIPIRRSDLKKMTSFFNKKELVDELTGYFSAQQSNEYAGMIKNMTRQGLTFNEIKNQLKLQGVTDKDILKIQKASSSLKDRLNDGRGSKSGGFATRAFARDLGKIVEDASSSLLSVGKDESITDYFSTGYLLGDSIKNFIDFRRVLYQTAGITKEATAAQEAFFDIYEQSKDINVSQDKLEKSLIKNTRSGLRFGKESIQVAKAQLLTEKQLGMESDELNDYFRQLNMSFGLTGTETLELGKDLMSVAKSSGLTGEAMKSVITKTEEMAKVLRGLGTFSLSSNKSMSRFIAEAQKLDAGDFASKLLKDTAGRTNLFASEMVGALGSIAEMSGTMDEIQIGQLFENPQNVKKFANSFENFLQKTTGVKTIEELNKLSYEAAKGNQEAQSSLLFAQQQAESVFKQPIGDVLRGVESLRKSSMGFSEEVADLEKRRRKGEIDAKAFELEKIRLTRESYKSVSDELLNTLKNTDNMDTALKDFEASIARKYSKEDIEKLFGAGGLDSQKAIMNYISSINQELEKAKMPELKYKEKDIADILGRGKPEELSKFLADLKAMEGRALAEQQALSNPLDKAAKEMRDLTATLRKILMVDFFVAIEKTFDKYLYHVAAAIAVISEKFLKLKSMFYSLFDARPFRRISEAFSSMARLVSPLHWITSSLTGAIYLVEGLGTGINNLILGIETRLAGFLNWFGTWIGRLFRHPIMTLNLIGGRIGQFIQVIDGFITSIAMSVNNFFDWLIPLIRNFFRVITSFNLVSVTRTWSNFMQGLRTLLGHLNPVAIVREAGMFIRAFVTGITTGLRFGLGGLRGLAQSFMGPFGIILSIIDGVIGAFSGWSRAAEMFGVSADKVTTEMNVIGAVTGGITGILNGLTFGLLRVFGGYDAVEKFIFDVVNNTWKFLKGFWEGLVEAFDEAKPAIMDALYGVWDAIKEVGSIFGELFTEVAQALGFEGIGINVSDWKELGKNVAKVLGPIVLKGIEYAILGLKFVIKLFGFLIKIIKPFIKAFAEGIGNIFGGIKKIFGGSIMEGLMQLAWGFLQTAKFWFFGLVDMILGFFGFKGSLGEKIYGFFTSLFGEKFVNTVVDAYKATAKWFDDLIIKPLGDAVQSLIAWAKSLKDWWNRTKEDPNEIAKKEAKKEQDKIQKALEESIEKSKKITPETILEENKKGIFLPKSPEERVTAETKRIARESLLNQYETRDLEIKARKNDLSITQMQNKLLENMKEELEIRENTIKGISGAAEREKEFYTKKFQEEAESIHFRKDEKTGQRTIKGLSMQYEAEAQKRLAERGIFINSYNTIGARGRKNKEILDKEIIAVAEDRVKKYVQEKLNKSLPKMAITPPQLNSPAVNPPSAPSVGPGASISPTPAQSGSPSVQPAAAANSPTQSTAAKSDMERGRTINNKLAVANSNSLSGIEENTKKYNI
jgi:hypothetical protein